jgi:hypothetical protein
MSRNIIFVENKLDSKIENSTWNATNYAVSVLL